MACPSSASQLPLLGHDEDPVPKGMSHKEKLLRLQVLLPKIGTPPEQYGLEGTDSQGPLLGRPRASERALIAPGNFQVGSNELKARQEKSQVENGSSSVISGERISSC